MGFRGGGGTGSGGAPFAPPTGQIQDGAVQAEGGANSTVRSDHVHAFPAAPGGSGATNSTPGDAQADGAATTVTRSDHKHGREAWGAAGDIHASAPGNAAAAGASAKTADAAHVHARESWGADGDVGTGAFGTAAGAGASGKVADAGHTHATPAGVAVEQAGTLESTRPTVNFIPGSGVTLTVADNAGAGRCDVTIATGGAASGTILAQAQYAPGTATSYTVNSTTLTALSTTNMTTGAFTAPTSGDVIVEVEVDTTNVAGNALAFALFSHSTTTQVGNTTPVFTLATSVATDDRVRVSFLVTGLTPGNTYQFDLAAASSGSCSVKAQGGTGYGATPPYGPARMTVIAAL